MTNPSNANTSGLSELIQSRIGQDFDGECHLTDDEAQQVISALVTAASAQARIAELEAERDDVSALRKAIFRVILNEGDVMVAPGEEPDAIRRIIDRATAAEARADRLAKALEAARGTLDAIDCPLTTDQTVAGAAKHAVKRIDAALQQETQP